MRKTIIAVTAALSLPLLAAAPPRGTVALGVGASSPTDIIVKIDGKNTHVKLAGIASGNPKTQTFLDCLVAKRVLRVDRAAGRATMLDGTSVADHVAEFEQTKTSSDPCALGRSSYVAELPPLATTAAAAPPAARRGTVSYGSTTQNAPPPDARERMLGVSGQGAAAKKPSVRGVPPGYETQTEPSIYRPPTLGTTTMGQAPTYGAPTVSTTTYGQAQGYTPGQSQTVTPPTATTTTIPTTTAPPLLL